MLKKSLLAFTIIFGICTQKGFTQASLVPVYHQVYDWMHYQRILGNVPNYNYEALPLTRGQITSLLEAIDDSKLNNGNQEIRDSYLREFSVDSLKSYKNNSILQGSDKIYNRILELGFSEDEPHIYVWNSDKADIAVDGFIGYSGLFVKEGDEEYNSPFFIPGGIRSYGTFSDVWGYHYEQWTIGQMADRTSFEYLPFFSRNNKFLIGGDEKNHFESFAGFQKGMWSLHIGRGTLKYGVGQRNNLVFSREGIPFDWVRFNINSKYVKYTLIQGSLTWKPVQKPLEGYPGFSTRQAPSRWTVHQRLQIQPAKWISFSFYELIGYSNREFEITYLNPVARLSLSEFEQQDQDNGYAGFEGVLRPIDGLELFGEILIDDLGSTGDLFKWENKKATNSTFARYLGFYYALKTGTVISSTYQRVEPTVYTHKYQLNSHTEKGIGLGSQIGPNGDELSIGIEQWLSHRTRLAFRYDYDRHGMNYFDENGGFIDAGGDILDSYYIDPDTGQISRASEFLGGDLHKWNRYTLSAIYEPWRGIKLSAEYSFRYMLQGSQLNDLSFLNFTLQLGY